MSAIKGKKSLLWTITIIITSIFAGGISNYITHKDTLGSIITTFILTLIPFLIEYF